MCTCENCSIEYEASQWNERFCSKRCARSFAAKARKPESNLRLSLKLKHPLVLETRVCEMCKTEFEVDVKNSKRTCSLTCGGRLSALLGKEKLSVSAKRRHASGESNFGWQVRPAGLSSMPEKYFETVFSSRNIPFEREVKFGKYFVDFLFKDSMIVLEVDGKQHERAEDRAIDMQKDAFLQSCGLEVVRIKWTSPTGKSKHSLESDIQGILNQVSNTRSLHEILERDSDSGYQNDIPSTMPDRPGSE